MNNSIAYITERHEPLLQIRYALCGLMPTFLIGPSSIVNGLFFRRPHQDLGIVFSCVWQRLEEASKFLGALPVITCSC